MANVSIDLVLTVQVFGLNIESITHIIAPILKTAQIIASRQFHLEIIPHGTLLKTPHGTLLKTPHGTLIKTPHGTLLKRQGTLGQHDTRTLKL